MRIETNAPFPNRIQWYVEPYVGSFLQPGPLGAFDPRRDLEVYVDGVLTPVSTFSFDAVNNRYLLYFEEAINVQGVIQVVHHMPDPPFINGIIPLFAGQDTVKVLSSSATIRPPLTVTADTASVKTANASIVLNPSVTLTIPKMLLRPHLFWTEVYSSNQTFQVWATQTLSVGGSTVASFTFASETFPVVNVQADYYGTPAVDITQYATQSLDLTNIEHLSGAQFVYGASGLNGQYSTDNGNTWNVVGSGGGGIGDGFTTTGTIPALSGTANVSWSNCGTGYTYNLKYLADGVWTEVDALTTTTHSIPTNTTQAMVQAINPQGVHGAWVSNS